MIFEADGVTASAVTPTHLLLRLGFEFVWRFLTMIAAALRTEIELFCNRTLERSELETLARCALATQRLTQGLRAAGDESLPGLRTIRELVDRAARSQPAAFLAYRALAEHLVSQVAPSSGAAAAREAAFDTIDDLVDDPAELPVLRVALGTFCDQFQHACQESVRASRRSTDIAADAA